MTLEELLMIFACVLALVIVAAVLYPLWLAAEDDE